MAETINNIATEQALMNSLENMHTLASGALSRIRGIARCVLFSLETEIGLNNPEAIAEALQSIIMDADMTHNDVGCEAERLGIQTIDRRRLRRLDATHQNRKRIAADARACELCATQKHPADTNADNGARKSATQTG